MTVKKKKKSKKELSLNKIIKEKESVIQNLESEITLLSEKNVKLLAEFDNFQRRTFDEKEKMRKFESLNFIRDLLPAIDDINRTIEFDHIENNDSLIEAIKMIHSKIEHILAKHSIKKIKSTGNDFDPNLHEALLEQDSNTLKKGKIIEEYENAYMYHEKVIRHAKVVVSKGKSK